MAGRNGQPAFIPTAEQRFRVENLVAAQTRVPVIALMLGLPQRTVERHFARELSMGREVATAHFLELLWADARAKDGKPVSKIFLAKTQAGYEDGFRSRVQIESKAATGGDPTDRLFTINIIGGPS